MKPPVIYAEWIPVLEKFGRGEQDGEVAAAMQADCRFFRLYWNGSPYG